MRGISKVLYAIIDVLLLVSGVMFLVPVAFVIFFLVFQHFKDRRRQEELKKIAPKER